jgi:hypothetical protein
MEELVIRFAIPWLLSHPAILSFLAWGFTVGTLVSEVWTRIPAAWRAAVKARWPRIAGALDAVVGYWPSLHKGNSAIVHGVIRGKVKPERVTKEQLADIINDALSKATPVPAVPAADGEIPAPGARVESGPGGN